MLFRSLLAVFLVLPLTACSAFDAGPVKAVKQPLTLDMNVNTTSDVVSSGVCSLRGAMISAFNHAAGANNGCPSGLDAPNVNRINLPGGTYTLSIMGANEDSSATGDLDYNGKPLEIIGNGSMTTNPMNPTIIDANSLDRIFHGKGGNGAWYVSISGMTLIDGCANGGGCTANGPGGYPAAGGALYHNCASQFYMDDVEISGCRGSQGGGLAVCAAPALTSILTNLWIHDNTALSGGGGIDAHTTFTISDSLIEDNVVTGFGTGGNIRQYDRLVTIMDTDILNGVATVGSGGNIAIVGKTAGTAESGQLLMQGGTLSGGKAAADGGNLYVGGGIGGTGLFNAPCGGTGCAATLLDVTVTSGRADDPVTGNVGNGGNLCANPTGANVGKITLNGSTSAASGVDLSSPMSPDCFGSITLNDMTSVANTANCTITDNRMPSGPVCGNNMVEMGEQCDGTVCCAMNCTWATSGTGCSDSDACTVGDMCNGSGTCQSGTGSTCGDGTTQAACGEECDDNNTTSLDGCSSMCHVEMCVQWE